MDNIGDSRSEKVLATENSSIFDIQAARASLNQMASSNGDDDYRYRTSVSGGSPSAGIGGGSPPHHLDPHLVMAALRRPASLGMVEMPAGSKTQGELKSPRDASTLSGPGLGGAFRAVASATPLQTIPSEKSFMVEPCDSEDTALLSSKG